MEHDPAVPANIVKEDIRAGKVGVHACCHPDASCPRLYKITSTRADHATTDVHLHHCMHAAIKYSLYTTLPQLQPPSVGSHAGIRLLKLHLFGWELASHVCMHLWSLHSTAQVQASISPISSVRRMSCRLIPLSVC